MSQKKITISFNQKQWEGVKAILGDNPNPNEIKAALVTIWELAPDEKAGRPKLVKN